MKIQFKSILSVLFVELQSEKPPPHYPEHEGENKNCSREWEFQDPQS